MNPRLSLFLVRHGETEWSLSGQHTGRTDIPLTAKGEDQSRELLPWLRHIHFARVFTSPRQRARRTCALAGLGDQAEIEQDLQEWDYGDYEGKLSSDIRKHRPGWNAFQDGCPGGEMPEQIDSRADRLIARLCTLDGNVALFSHGEFGVALAARWIGIPVIGAQHFSLGTASLSILSYNPAHPEIRVIELWNASPAAFARMEKQEFQVRTILGPPRFDADVAQHTAMPGVATGLAWVGGDILFIEASRVPGTGKLILTGQLGDVMKESVQAAMSLLRTRAAAMGIDGTLFTSSDVHVHVPAGATPKDGPSAGVAMFTALASLMTGRVVPPTTAMTGEISLRGLVLLVGGIREKVIAAARAGIDTVLLPARNRRDLEDIPQSTRDRLRFVWLETVDDAVAATIGTGIPPVADPVMPRLE